MNESTSNLQQFALNFLSFPVLWLNADVKMQQLQTKNEDKDLDLAGPHGADPACPSWAVM